MITRRTRQIRLAALGLAGLLAMAVPALAQRETPPTLRSNPYRDIGGSCVYGKQGEVLYAPKGADCPDRTNHLGAAQSASTSKTRFQELPPAYRAEANGLVSDHEHIATELGELRQAIARNQREQAMTLADKLVAELREHLTREEGFLDKLAVEHRTH